VQLVATATTPNRFAALQIYVDGVKVHEQTTTDLNRTLMLAGGQRHIAVKGWDNMGSFMSTVRITVPPNQFPVVSLAVTPTSGFSPVTVTASTAGSSDPDGAIASTTVNFGDGTVASVAPGGSASHVYSAAGTYLVSATVTDNNAAQSSVAASVNVVAPYVSISVPRHRAIGIAPIKVVASAHSGNPIAGMKIYVDDKLVYQTTASQINTYLKMARGTRRIIVQAWETNGTLISSSVTITVR
jgi:PKD repeat protein